jgi:hypothetical protein
MRILCVVTGNYGNRIVSHLCQTAPADWQVLSWEGPKHLPPVVDEPERFLPTSLPQADLLLSLAEHAGLSDLVADLAEQCGAQAVIAPIDRWSWLPPGLSRQLAQRLQDRGMGCAFPSPFCSLRPSHQGHPLINAFADRFGSPELRCTVVDGYITAWEIQREAPCGNTRFVVNKLVGVTVERAEEMAGLLHHYYPCLAVMDQVGAHSHTLLHQAAKIARSAVARALSDSQRVHVIQPSTTKLHGEE